MSMQTFVTNLNMSLPFYLAGRILELFKNVNQKLFLKVQKKNFYEVLPDDIMGLLYLLCIK
jgi:hypothetical protein